jgi:MiaB/RimO family radical SAM methylthiotransferase
MRRAYLMTIGACYPSGADFRLIKTYLRSNGWVLSKRIENAAVIIIYTCAFNKEAEDLSIQYIRKAQKGIYRHAQIIVTGCLPAINRSRLKQVFKGTVVAAASLQEFDKVLNAQVGIRDIAYSGPSGNFGNIRAKEYLLRIGWGCHGKCSYCAVRKVHGKPRSRSLSDILHEFNIAYSKGYRSYVLIANDVGCYGEELDTSLPYLIRKLCLEHRDCQFAVSHLAPDKLKEMLPLLKGFIRAGRLWRLNIPVESGSNRIIRLMNRTYTVDDFKYCVEQLISCDPNVVIKTDVMVGFPSETEQDFLDTLRLVEWLGRYRADIQCLPYGKRPNTEASKMSKQISLKTKNARLKRLHKLCKLSYVLRNRQLFKKLKRSHI